MKQQWHVGAEVVAALMASANYVEEVPSDPFAEEKTGENQNYEAPKKEWTIEELLQKNGVEIPLGGSATYDRSTGILTSINTQENALATEMLLLNNAISVSKERSDKNARASVPDRKSSAEMPAKNQNELPRR